MCARGGLGQPATPCTRSPPRGLLPGAGACDGGRACSQRACQSRAPGDSSLASSRAVMWQLRVSAQPETATAHGADASLSSSTVTANAARDGVATGSGATTLGHAHTPRLARPENNPRSAAQRPDVDLEQDQPAPTNRPGSPGYTRVCARGRQERAPAMSPAHPLRPSLPSPPAPAACAAVVGCRGAAMCSRTIGDAAEGQGVMSGRAIGSSRK